MSDKELALPTALPAYLQGYESETAGDLVISGISLPRISLRGKQFRFRKDDTERALPLGQPLEIVIVGTTPKKGLGKSYYSAGYREGDDEPPTCSSANGVAPDNWITDPQSSNCATCRHNVFGSRESTDGTVTKGKACADSKQLLVLPPDAPLSDIWALKVPPASLKLLTAYGQKLKTHKIPVELVVTKIVFEDAEYPKVNFSFSRFVDEAHAENFKHRVASDELRELIESLSSVTVVDEPVEKYEEPPVASQIIPTEQVDTLTDDIPFGETTQEPPAGAQNQKSQPDAAAPQQAQQQKRVQAPDGSYFVDDTGAVFNKDEHAQKSGCVGGTLKQDGSFRARSKRGAAAAAAATSQPEQQPVKQEPQKDAPSLFGNATMEGQESQADTTSDADELAKTLEEWGL